MPSTPSCHGPGPLKSFSFGGGWQSTAALVLAARGELDYQTFMFANVGDDSEHPATLRYVREYAMPFAAEHGIELTMLDRIMQRTGEKRTLYQDLTREGSRSLKIPVRMSNGAPGTRSCTAQFKIEVIGRELKRRGATGGKRCRSHRREDRTSGGCLPGRLPSTKQHDSAKPHDCDRGPRPGCIDCTQPNRATIGIGISVDEIERANARRAEPHEILEYPLLQLGIRRADCPRIIRSAGLPVPPKSSCWFCPFHRPETWQDMRRDEPELFERACGLEDLLNTRRDELGKDHVYLTRFAKPLRQAIPAGVDLLPLADDDASCDGGWCFT